MGHTRNARKHSATGLLIADNTEPQRIRLLAADLVRQDKLAEADLLTASALEAHPNSQDVLAIRALILQVMQDWSGARQVLQRLLKLQGDAAPAETWCHWVRVLRCEGLAMQAMDAASDALNRHPEYPSLSAELASLQFQLRPVAAQLQA